MTVYSYLKAGTVPGAFAKLMEGQFPPKLLDLFVFLLTTSNGFSAAVIARDADDARRLALLHDPRGWWHTSASEMIAETRPTRTCRVLAMEMLR
jgi:hypothetical protein